MNTIASRVESDPSTFGPSTETVVHDFPAVLVVRRTGAFGKPVRITADDRLAVMTTWRGEPSLREYAPGSVVSYAMHSGECPIRAVARATERGHNLHWINSCGAMISSRPQAKRKLIAVEVGMEVLFEGRVFRITSEPNSNLGLSEVVEGGAA